MNTGFDERAAARTVLLGMPFDHLECALDEAVAAECDVARLISTLQESLALATTLAAFDRQ